jgi:hypothetical protein
MHSFLFCEERTTLLDSKCSISKATSNAPRHGLLACDLVRPKDCHSKMLIELLERPRLVSEVSEVRLSGIHV